MVILKDKFGNILTRPKNYSATDEQVQNAIDTRIADGTLNIDSANTRNLLAKGIKVTGVTNLANNASNQIGYKYKIEAGKKYVTNTAFIQNNGLRGVQFFDSGNNRIFASYDGDLTEVQFTTVNQGQYVNCYNTFVAPQNTDYLISVNKEMTLVLYDDFVKLGKFPNSNDVEIDFNGTKKFIIDGVFLNSLPTLQGKWIAFGDSYTNYLAREGGNFEGLALRFGIDIINKGIASSTIKNSSNGGSSYQPMVDRVDAIVTEYANQDVKLITFMGGTNDSWGKDSSLGNDIYDMSKGHIYGACHYIFNKLKTSFPNAKILVILQPSCANYQVSSITDDTTAQSLGFTDLANAQQFDDMQISVLKSQIKQRIVREVAEFYGLEVLDCCFNWYSPMNPSELTKYWADDKLHLTNEGNADITNRVRLKIYDMF